MSRPFVLVALGVLLAVATFASMRSAADSANADDTSAAPTVVRPAPGATTPKPDDHRPGRQGQESGASRSPRRPSPGMPAQGG